MARSVGDQLQSLVACWTSTGAFDHALANAFGSVANASQVVRLRNLLLSWGTQGFPEVVELSPQYLKNHLAAYSAETNTVYVDPDLKWFPGLAESALAHELGHWADYHLHGEFTDHASARSFAFSLTGRALTDQKDSSHAHDKTGKTEKLTLPSGEIVDAQFFDTPTHVNWIKEQLPFLSAAATQTITNAQNDTDYFNASSYNTVGPLKYSPYGLQTHSPSHFDNNNISGGLGAIRSRWTDGINRFNAVSIQAVTSEQFLGKDRIDALANPLFNGPDAGIQLLLYRFGQINHAFEDFYSHSNWVESAKKGLIGSAKLLEGGLDLPIALQPGDQIEGTNVFVAQSGPDWSAKLKKSGRGSYSGSKYDVYWNVDSSTPSKGGGIVSATTIDGKTIYGLATGATNGAIYKDRDSSVFLRDPSKTGILQKEYFRGFDHGGIAGTVYGQWVGPLNKDKDTNPDFLAAKKLANLQLQNEWDRMGNLIYKSYGVDGLRRFANYALATQEARDAYITTFSKPGARYFGSPSSLNLSSASASSIFSEEVDSASQSETVPDIRVVRLFSKEFFDPSSPFGSYQDRYQFLDAATGLWLDTDFNDISIHHELDSDDIANLTTPSSIQHAARGERAAWSFLREESAEDSATNYYVESNNSDVSVYIDDFDVCHDRVVLVDAAGRETSLPEDLYEVTTVDQLTAELAKYGIFVNLRAVTELVPRTVLITESQLASSLLVEASDIAGDLQGESLFFTGYDDSIPFLELVDGALRATSIDPKYAGNTYIAYVDISDGTSVARGVPVRIAVAPKLVINGESFDSETSFRLKINGLTGQAFDIVVQVADHLENTLDRFLAVATSIGSSSSVPIGYDSSELTVNLSDDLDSGVVSFWLQDISGELRSLSVVSLTGGGFNLLLDGAQVAQLSPVLGGAATPEVSMVSYSNLLDDGLCLRLNQEFVDVTSRDMSTPWTVTLSMDLFREAAYSSQVGLFLFDRISASIVDPVTGISPGTPNSAWYEDAERHAVWTGTTADMTSSSFTTAFKVNGQVDLDTIALMPFMRTQIEGQFFYFSTFDGLNVDGGRHIAELSRNVFGFEDTLGLGDGDLDDMILRINTLAVS